uniref:Gp5/Type VI secretion system Vgr protein OB-fold domain-containing protein n=1 Tax=candidate division WOR-3 bacterium TaxID=2052148 RepID=A0A7C6ECF8_UNCW3
MIDLIRTEIKKSLARLTFFAIGEIIKIDFTNYQAQAKILTTGMKTNWLRIGTNYSGDGFGEVKSLNIGDEVLICFPDGNPSAQGIIMTRLFGKDVPPQLTEDEYFLHHKSGTKILIRQNGNIEVTTKSGLKFFLDDAAKKIILDSTSDKIFMDSSGIKIGSQSAGQALVLGYKLLAWLASHTHISAPPGQPTSPPTPSPDQSLLSQRHKTQ